MTASRSPVILTLFCLLSVSMALAQFGSTVQYFPQFAIDGGARTIITIHNPGKTATTVDLTLTRSNGSTHFSDQITVHPGVTEIATFGEPSGTPIAGWVKLTADEKFVATLSYRITGVGNVGVLPSPQADAMKVVSFVGGAANTGFAVANPSDTATSALTFKISNAEGQLLREVPLTLGPREHRAFLFSETPYEVEGLGLVTVQASEPVVALALRLDGSFLSGVGVVVPGLPIRGEWNGSSPNIIGGWEGNTVGEGVEGATIGGGGRGVGFATAENRVMDSWGTVSGGTGNAATAHASVGGGSGNTAIGSSSSIGGGYSNTASGGYSFIGGGWVNYATGAAGAVAGGELNTADEYGAVGGGEENTASGKHSSVGGGLQNTASKVETTVGGGSSNTASGVRSTVSGGGENTANGDTATVCGGANNIASGSGSTVGGGSFNTASGANSFAAGHRAQAAHHGTFVWSDDRNSTFFPSTGPQQFLIRAAGGVGINTNYPQGTLDVNGSLWVIGSIYHRGQILHADYVFEPDYRLESIEEHSRLMWAEKHLPAVQAGEKDDEGREVIEYGSRMRGMLEELEKAHIYIEQLNRRLLRQEQTIEKLKDNLADR